MLASVMHPLSRLAVTSAILIGINTGPLLLFKQYSPLFAWTQLAATIVSYILARVSILKVLLSQEFGSKANGGTITACDQSGGQELTSENNNHFRCCGCWLTFENCHGFAYLIYGCTLLFALTKTDWYYESSDHDSSSSEMFYYYVSVQAFGFIHLLSLSNDQHSEVGSNNCLDDCARSGRHKTSTRTITTTTTTKTITMINRATKDW